MHVPHDAHQHAAVHPANQCVLKEGGQSKAAVALHFMHHNSARIHQTLRVTPAMEAGVSDHVWSCEDIVGLLDWAAAHPVDSK